jgi:ABC-type antimicrobial peptide transport system permease subunit
MFGNYWKIIFRNLRRYKSYSFINIVGMGVGIAAMVWGYQTYRYAFSFDNFHKNKDRVYRGLIYEKEAEGLRGIFPMPAVGLAKKDLAGVGDAVRFIGRGLNVRHNANETFAETVHFTDTGFFNLFTFPLVAGTNDLQDPNAVILTEKTAKKYFGNVDAIGQTLTFYAGERYARVMTVKGILKDLPVNSTLQFGMLANFDNFLKGDGNRWNPDDWSLFLNAAFFYIPDPANVPLLEKELARWVPVQNKSREDAKVSGFKLVTLTQNARWRDVVGANYLWQRPDDAAAYGPLVLAFLIFLSSCLNFSNTTVSHAGTRLKEIGIRKVMGSTYRELMTQLLAECSLIVAVSVLLSMLFNSWWIPAFNSMFEGVDVHADYLHDRPLLTFMACMLLGATLLAGTYPAVYLSRFNPTAIFRGRVRFGGTNLFSRLMLGLQLSIAIITVTAGIAFARNAAFQKNFDYGYNIESNMGVVLHDSSDFAALKNRLAALPDITGVAGTRNQIGFAFRRVVSESEGSKKEVEFLEVGRDFTEIMGLRIATGREFNALMSSDYQNALLITQKMAAQYGWKDAEAPGKRIRIDSATYSVVGVLKDFHTATLFDPSEPVAIKLAKENRYQFLIVRAKEKDLTNVFAEVKTVWKDLFPERPYNGFYQDQLKAEAARTTRSIATIFLWFGVISVLLTATGLFALISLTTMKKMKEIAVRKVVGAGPRHILVLINKGYFWIFIVASVLGCYAGLALTRLLLDLIFKVNNGVATLTLIASIAVLFVIAAVTSGIKVWQAVRSNPVKMLRAE